MRKGDYSKKKGTLKTDYERPFETPTGQSAVIKCTLTQNYKKGYISVTGIINHSHISNNLEERKASLQALSELMEEAMLDGIEWKKKWNSENSDIDPDQLDMFDNNQEEE